jgi:hypothetical protein
MIGFLRLNPMYLVERSTISALLFVCYPRSALLFIEMDERGLGLDAKNKTIRFVTALP